MWSLRDSQGTPVIVKAAEGDCVEGVKAIVNGGADVDITDANGRTALHAAAAMSTAAMVQFLVERKDHIKAKTRRATRRSRWPRRTTTRARPSSATRLWLYLTKKGAPDKQ